MRIYNAISILTFNRNCHDPYDYQARSRDYIQFFKITKHFELHLNFAFYKDFNIAFYDDLFKQSINYVYSIYFVQWSQVFLNCSKMTWKLSTM